VREAERTEDNLSFWDSNMCAERERERASTTENC